MKKYGLTLLALLGCSTPLKYSSYNYGIVTDFDPLHQKVSVIEIGTQKRLEILVYSFGSDKKVDDLELERGMIVYYPMKLWGNPIFGKENIGLLDINELKSDAITDGY